TDDGRIQGTRDGGATWNDLTPNVPGLPEHTYVTRIVASNEGAGTVYAAFDGHRNDDFAPYVYVSGNHGESWRRITNGLPESSVNALAQHPRNPDLLFVGNEVGVWFSIDGGQRWASLGTNLPTTPVDDIEIHPRENDLVLGTHGRGAWIMSDIAPLEGLSPRVLAADAHLFPVRRATAYNSYDPQGWTPGVWAAENPPQGALIRYYLGRDLEARQEAVTDGENGSGDNGGGQQAGGGRSQQAHATVTIVDSEGETVRELEGPGEAGIQEVVWDLRHEPPYEPERGQGGGFFGAPRGPKVLPGTYTVRLAAAGQTMETPVEIRLDPRVEISQGDLMARQEAMMDAYRLAEPEYRAGRALDRLTEQLEEVAALLEEQESPPEALTATVDSLEARVAALDDELDRVGIGFASFAIEGSHTRPTDDQLWQIDRAWEEVPGIVERVNALVTEEMPALYDRLDQEGIRPDPGEAIAVPSRGGGG
ncbi:MAG TPA: hypothetical protein VLL48_04770, partial [Longimicrobiales bacterium]|nr:hypothetical protein [Longimicrobiales bacterium]